MPCKPQSTRYLYTVWTILTLLLIIYSFNVLIYLEKNHNSFGDPVFLHMQIVSQTAFFVN